MVKQGWQRSAAQCWQCLHIFTAFALFTLADKNVQSMDYVCRYKLTAVVEDVIN